MKLYWGVVRRGMMTGDGIMWDKRTNKYTFSELFEWELYGIVWGSCFLGFQKRIKSNDT